MFQMLAAYGTAARLPPLTFKAEGSGSNQPSPVHPFPPQKRLQGWRGNRIPEFSGGSEKAQGRVITQL